MHRIQRPSLIIVLSLIMIGGYGINVQAQIAKQGAPRGVVGFYGNGTTQEYAPDMVVWTGKFFGQSVTESGQGPLHDSAWDCTGEMVIRSGKIVVTADGFCAVTDQDGDKINLRWDTDDPQATPAKIKTKGTYLSGSGKYAGIQGSYSFMCRAVADTSHYICEMIGGDYRLP